MHRKTRAAVAVIAGMLIAGMAATSFAAPPRLVKPVNRPAAQPQSSDRIFVRYKSGTAASTDRQAKLRTVTTAAARAGVRHGTGTTAATRNAVVPLGATYQRRSSVGGDVIRLSRKLGPAEQTRLLKEIAADPAVAFVDVVRRAYPMGMPPNDAEFANYQWNLQAGAGGIDIPSAWDHSTGEGIVVAVIDTGILPNHPDRPANLLPGYDFISDATSSGRSTDGRVAGATDMGDWTADNQCYAGWVGQASTWHGTHVAGTVAEATHNGVGMAGVAYNATILPVRVLGHCGGWEDDIADAIVWASGGHVEGVPDNANPAEIINLSLGGDGACATRPLYQQAIDTAVANGSLVVAAAGNYAENSANASPASCNSVLTVGATGYSGQKASYSNFGSVVDLSGPGGAGVEGAQNGYIWQQGYDGATTNTSGAYTYVGMVGTSMATPHVAGVAALIQSALVAAGKPPLEPAALENLLKNTTRVFPVSPPSSTPIGTGIVNPLAALTRALEDPGNLEATPLVNKVNLTGLSSASSGLLYSFQAEAGKVLSIMTVGGTGNASVYVSFEAAPTEQSYQYVSARPGNSETVRISAPRAGTYYIRLAGSFSGMTLVARQ